MDAPENFPHESDIKVIFISPSQEIELPASTIVQTHSHETMSASPLEKIASQEYHKVHRGLTTFVDTIRKVLLEKGLDDDGDCVAKLLANLESLPLSSEGEFVQNVQQITVFILTAFTVMADMITSLIRADSAAVPATSHETERFSQSVVKMEGNQEQLSCIKLEYCSDTQSDVDISSERDRDTSMSPTVPVHMQAGMPLLKSEDTTSDIADPQPEDSPPAAAPQESLLERQLKIPVPYRESTHSNTANRKRGRPKGSTNSQYPQTSSSSVPQVYWPVLPWVDGRESHSTLDLHVRQALRSQLGDALRPVRQNEEDASAAQADCDRESSQGDPEHSLVTVTDSDPEFLAKRPKRPGGRPRKLILCDSCALIVHGTDGCTNKAVNPFVHAATSTECQSVATSLGTDGKRRKGILRKRLVCVKCSQTFTRVEVTHKFVRTGNKELKAGQDAAKLKEDFHGAQTSFSQSLNEGQQVRRKRGRPLTSGVCPYCDRIISPRYKVIFHIRSVHPEHIGDGPEPFVCKECGQSFTWLSAFRSHLQRHKTKEAGDRPFSCTSCTKSFVMAGELKHHMRRHERRETGERPFSCATCNKSFLTAGELKYHKMDVHEGIRRFLCTICGSAFKRRFALNSHLKLHEGVEKHACPVCGKTFPLPQYLKKHMAFHDPESVYQCEYCPKQYSTRSSLSVHLLKSRVCPGSQMGPGKKTETSE